MSVKVMAMVWEHYPVGGGELLTALAYADHAHDDGAGVRPSVAHIAKKTRQSERTIQMHLAAMRQTTWLLTVRYAEGGRGRVTEYRVNPSWISNPAGFAPFLRPIERVQSTAEKGAVDGAKGCKAFAPQPPRTIIKPTTTTAPQPAAPTVVVVDSGDTGSLNLHGLFDGQAVQAAHQLLTRCPADQCQAVIDEIAGVNLNGKLRGPPIVLLRSLIEKARVGEFMPLRAFEFREYVRRQDEERERRRQEHEQEAARQSPVNRELAMKTLTQIRASMGRSVQQRTASPLSAAENVATAGTTARLGSDSIPAHTEDRKVP